MSDHPICHIEIPALDREATCAFYSDVLGGRWPSIRCATITCLRRSVVLAVLSSRMEMRRGRRVGEVLIYIFTDDIDATLANAEAQGVKTLTPIYGWSNITSAFLLYLPIPNHRKSQSFEQASQFAPVDTRQ